MTKATQKNLESLGIKDSLKESISAGRRAILGDNRYNIYKNTDQAYQVNEKFKGIKRHNLTNYLYELEKIDDPNTDYLDFYLEFDPSGPLSNQQKYIETFSKDIPEIQNMNDFQLAEFVYKQIQSPYKKKMGIGDEQRIVDMPRKTRKTFNEFFDIFISKPRGVKENIPYSPTEFLDTQSQLSPEYTVKEIADKYGYGTDVYEGAASANFAKTLGVTDQDGIDGVDRVLEAKYGKGTKTYMDDVVGELVFNNPETGLKTLVDPPSSFGMEDIAEQGGNALVLIPDAVGAFMGAVLGRTGIGAAALGGATGYDRAGGSGAFLGTLAGLGTNMISPGFGELMGAGLGSGYGTAFGDATRVYLGNRLYGINKDDEGNDYENWTDALKKQGKFDNLNAIVTSSGLGMEKTFGLIKNIVKGNRIDPKIVNEIKKKKMSTEEANDLVKDMNETLKLGKVKQNLKFSLGEAINDPKQLRKQKRFEDNENYGFQGRLDTFNEERAEALKAYLMLQAKNLGFSDYMQTSPLHKEKIGKLIQGVVEKRLNPRRKLAIKTMEDTDINLTNKVLNLKSGDTKAAGVEISSIVKDLYKTEKQNITAEYANLFELGKARKIKIEENGPVMTAYKELKDKLIANDVPESSINELLKDPMRKIGKGDSGVRTLDTMKKTITSLMRRDGDFYKIEGYPNNLIEAYKKELKNQLGDNDPWLQEYIDLSKKYEKFNKDFMGSLADVVQIGEGTVKIGDEDVFKQVFKKGTEKADRTNVDLTYQVLERRPETLDIVRDAIESKYRREVINADTGLPNPKAHKSFMDDEEGYGYALRKFFGEADYARINSLGDLTKVNQLKKVKSERVLKNLEKSTKGQLLSKKPSQVYDYLMDKNNPTQASKVMSILQDSPEVKAELKNKVVQQVYKTLIDERGNMTVKGVADLNKFLDKDDGFGETLKYIFNDKEGRKYLKNLEKVRKASQIMTRSRIQKGAPKSTTAAEIPQYAIDMARGILFRPLSREGKVFTSILKYAGLAMDERMADMMTNPKLLDIYLEAAGKPVRSEAFKKAMNISLGLPFKVDYEIDPEDEFESMKDLDTVPLKVPEIVVKPQTKIESPTSPDVNIFAEQTPRPTAQEPVVQQPVMASSSMPAPTEGMGIASLPPEQKAAKYAGLFEGDNLGQLIAQRGQNGRT